MSDYLIAPLRDKIAEVMQKLLEFIAAIFWLGTNFSFGHDRIPQ